MALSTVGDLIDALVRYGPSTPLKVLLRTPLDPGSELELRPMRISGRREVGVDLICMRPLRASGLEKTSLALASFDATEDDPSDLHAEWSRPRRLAAVTKGAQR